MPVECTSDLAPLEKSYVRRAIARGPTADDSPKKRSCWASRGPRLSDSICTATRRYASASVSTIIFMDACEISEFTIVPSRIRKSNNFRVSSNLHDGAMPTHVQQVCRSIHTLSYPSE